MQYHRWLYARQRYTLAMATARMLTNMYDIDHSRGVKTLGNFSVTRIDMNKGGGVPKKLEVLFQDAEDWEMTLKSGGLVGAGGRPVPVMAARAFRQTSHGPHLEGYRHEDNINPFRGSAPPARPSSPGDTGDPVPRGALYGGYLNLFPLT